MAYSIFKYSSAALLLAALLQPAYAAKSAKSDLVKPKYVITKKIQQSLTPNKVIQKLKDGNKRLLQNKTRRFDVLKLAKYTGTKGQAPMAAIVQCLDSRSDANVTFNQPIGALFVGAVAGNVVDANMLASLEFATKISGSKVIVIMGHTHCGAIGAACSNVKLGNITHLMHEIRPGIKNLLPKPKQVEESCKMPQFIDKLAKQNVIANMKKTLKDSPIIKGLVDSKAIMLVGAMHDVTTGKVEFFNINGKNI